MTCMYKPIHVTNALKRSDLPFAEQLFIWGIRMWAQGFNRDVNNHEILNKGFCLVGVRGAYEALNNVMSIFATSGHGIININCPQCAYITIDENRIMGAVAAWQSNADASSGNVFICSWLPPAALRIMRLPARHLVKTLKHGNLHIRPRSCECIIQFKDKIFPLYDNPNQLLH